MTSVNTTATTTISWNIPSKYAYALCVACKVIVSIQIFTIILLLGVLFVWIGSWNMSSSINYMKDLPRPISTTNDIFMYVMLFLQLIFGILLIFASVFISIISGICGGIYMYNDPSICICKSHIVTKSSKLSSKSK